MNETVIALIPARGGSEGIPRKNLAEVAGISLLERAIRSATESPHVSNVVVSSDAKEIQDTAKKLGAIPLNRPTELSLGTTRAEAVVNHFLATPEASSLHPSDLIVYLQPTSPFRSSSHVTAALESMDSAKADFLVSVKEASEHPSKTLSIDERGVLKAAPFGEDSSANRQELPSFHYPNGAIYAFKVGVFRRVQIIPVVGALPFLMDAHESIDIDTPNDLMIARAVADYALI